MVNIFKTFFKNTSFHGYHYLVDRRLHWTEVVFWIACIIASTTCGIVLMIESLDEFNTHPITQTVNTLYLGWDTRLPTLIICENTNHEKMIKLIDEDPQINWNFNGTTCHDGFQEIVFFNGKITQVSCLETGEFDNYNLSNLYEKMLSQCEELFHKCSLMNEELNCCKYFLPVFTVRGYCYAFNSLVNKPKDNRVFTSKSQAFLSVEMLSTRVSSYLVSSEELTLKSESNMLFGTFIVDGKTKYTAYARVQEVINGPGVEKISIEKRSCRFQHENYLSLSDFYSNSACLSECLEGIYLTEVQCLPHIMPGALKSIGIAKPRICNASELLYISNHFDDIFNKMTSCDCVSTCSETEIIIVGVQLTYDSVDIKDKNTKLKMDLVVSQPTMRYYRTVVKDDVDLIVSLGGIATLFFGASFLSTVEIIYYFIVRPFGDYLIKKKKRQMIKDVISSNNKKHQSAKRNIPAIYECNQYNDGDIYNRKPYTYIK